MLPFLGMEVDPRSGLMRGGRLRSPNRDARPPGVAADLIVVHGISLPPGEFGGPWIDRLFTNPCPRTPMCISPKSRALRVSSHLCIGRDGSVTQYVKFHERAWHAGQSSWEGRAACNDFSIGVELEGADTVPYEPPQYRALAQVVAALCRAYPRVVARPPGRPQRCLPGPQDRSRARLRLGACPPPDCRVLRADRT